MAAYVIYQCEVLDAQSYEAYKPKAAASVEAAGGRYVVRGGDVDALEGEPPPGRTVLIEFPDRETACRWYKAKMYAEARKVREGAAIARMYVVDAVV